MSNPNLPKQPPDDTKRVRDFTLEEEAELAAARERLKQQRAIEKSKMEGLENEENADET